MRNFFKSSRGLTLMSKAFKGTPQGFTLIELIIVITILCFLVVLGYLFYSGHVQKSRDVKRMSDLKFLQTLISVYYIDHGFYPTAQTAGITTFSCPVNATPTPYCKTLQDELKKYAPKLPFDPLDTNLIPGNCSNSSCYYYETLDPTHTEYCLCVNLEGGRNHSTPLACQNTNFNYCIMGVL